MMMKDMGKLYPEVRRKVTNNLDESMHSLRYMYEMLDECNYAMDFDADFIYEFLVCCDEVKKYFRRATDAMEKGIPTLDDDDLPPCPICGAKVEVCNDSPGYCTSYSVSCTRCRYSLESESFPVSDERAKRLARQSIMQTYVAETRRSEE